MARQALIPLLILITTACTRQPTVTIGSKNFTEQLILGEIAAQLLERQPNLRVERKLNLGGTLLAYNALRQGDIDLYPEYTGTALTAILKQPPVTDPAEALRRVRQAYQPQGIEWLDPLGFNNTFALVIRTADASRDNLTALSQAATRPWILGAGYEFATRPDGLPGLLKTYPLQLQGNPVTMDLGLLYQALAEHRIDLAAANSTDGLLADPQFTVLEDDRHFFPPYQAAFAVRSAALTPAVRRTLQQLSGRITNATMRRLNAEVTLHHRPIPDVARQFLAQSGL
jgi:glycine betaine/choline ABC-type transport system substrate-binding protein